MQLDSIGSILKAFARNERVRPLINDWDLQKGNLELLNQEFVAALPLVKKALYISALYGAVEKAEKSSHFNLDTHMNDLWIKLSQIKGNNSIAAAKMQRMVESRSEMFQMLQRIIEKYEQTSRSIIDSLGR